MSTYFSLPYRKITGARVIFAALGLLLLAVGGWSSAGIAAPSESYPLFLPMTVMEMPPSLTILNNSTSHITPWGSLHVIGELTNNGEIPLTDIIVRANVYNSRGKLIGTGSTSPYLHNLEGGAAACFEIIFDGTPAGFSTYTVELANPPAPGIKSPSLSVLSASGVYDPSKEEYLIEGTVRNDQGTRVDNVRLVGALYTSAGKITGCSYEYVSGIYLTAGQVGSFKISFYDHKFADINAFRLQADGVLH